ncbi:Tripartite-type tricarboxylate transporter, receptor component TctC [Noviherbaspirillum humi]|uniref:Tripartite-type tricarboxylate transporter, receptor component TctC n=1 Tax=Noviherbaspirillum humi TaxID=1688639 RepID=A0A239M892_9BURK|nr:tripartite tricarboxylate transporter substrate binding protein [Noviherbaspirillum humi]SNT38264.1 Tripartite-type tricarboxylate transporter, receptor component TctC [Noviherbaspirillum humi]
MKIATSLAALGFILATAVSLPSHAQAQSSAPQGYPSRPIQFIVPYTPGTTADVLARLLGPRISQHWGVPVVVDNKAGAAGIIGSDAVAKAAPDGYTFLFAATSYGTVAVTSKNLPFDPVKSFAPVSLLGTSAMTLVVNNRFPAQNMKEFVAEVKKQPGVLNYASPGIGSSQQLAMELLKQETGINLTHVPYKGSSGAINDIVAGHVQASVVSVQSATPLVQSGKMRMLAVLGNERVPTFPQVPTVNETGVANMVVETWYGVMAPAGTPAAIVNKMNAEINQLLALPEVKEAMAKQGVNPTVGPPERFGNLLRNELKLWSQVVSRGKISVD